MKKILIATFLFVFCTLQVGAFNFPEPDWGALLKAKEKMVTQSELELYTEASVESAPYYGARLEPRGGAYIGMIAEAATDYLPLGGYLTYIQDMYQDDLYYPANSMIRSDDVMTMVGWTIDDMYSVDYDKVRSVLNTLNSYNKPMLIRFANEMNVSALGNDPDFYIRVFRTVADMIHEYPNFAVVWSPNDLGALDRPFEYFYPGDEYVDWIGVSCYPLKYFQGNKNTTYKDSVYFMTSDYSWATNRIKPVVEFMEKKGIQKPLMISEGAVPSANKHGEDLQSWSAPRLQDMLYYLVMKYPQIKMINYFNHRQAGEHQTYDICHQYLSDIFKEAAGSGAYIRKANGKPDFVYQPANYGETLVAQNGVIRLHTLAHFPGSPDISVNYSLDGVWYRGSNQIPYTCRMHMDEITDGKHTLTVSTLGQSKKYTFYKSGNCIRFGAEPDPSVVEQNRFGISVTLNGEKMQFDQPPVLDNGRTLVPMRSIFEALGAWVEWNPDTRTVLGWLGDVIVTVQIDNTEMLVNKEPKVLDVPAKIVSDRTMVPVRAISESFGCDVKWDAENKTVIITTN